MTSSADHAPGDGEQNSNTSTSGNARHKAADEVGTSGKKTCARSSGRIRTTVASTNDRRVPIAQRPPLVRTIERGYIGLLRQIFRATHSADQRHSEKLWPHARIARDVNGRIEHFSLPGRKVNIVNGAAPDTLMADAPTEPAHLIASGPSVMDIDYSTLQLSNVMGVNGAIALAAQQPIKYQYYCVTDTGFIRQRQDLVAEIVSRDVLFFTTPIGLWNILHFFPAKALASRFFLIERVGLQALRPRQPAATLSAQSDGQLTLFDAQRELGFSHDIGRGVFPGGTVAYEALQILSWLGVRQIFLHGIDLCNAQSTPRFYETEDDKLPTQIHRQLSAEIEPSFRQSRPLLDAKGIRVCNLSPISALGEDIFPKVDWRALQAAK